MNFLREIFSKDSDKNNILEENRQLKVKKKYVSKELERLKEEKDEITTKYIELLEEARYQNLSLLLKIYCLVF